MGRSCDLPDFRGWEAMRSLDISGFECVGHYRLEVRASANASGYHDLQLGVTTQSLAGAMPYSNVSCIAILHQQRNLSDPPLCCCETLLSGNERYRAKMDSASTFACSAAGKLPFDGTWPMVKSKKEKEGSITWHHECMGRMLADVDC